MDKRKTGHKNKNNKATIPKGSRKIHIDNKVWHWKGTARGILIISPDHDKHVVGSHTIAGCTPDAWERGLYKKYSHMTPGKVKQYIEENIV